MLDLDLSSDFIEQAVRDFHRDGFCLLRGLLPVEKIKNWASNFAPFLERHLLTPADPTVRGAQRFYITLPFKQPYADPEFFENETIMAIVKRLAGADFVMCQLATDTPLLGSEFQEIHADAPPLFPEENTETPSFQLAMNFALCDVTLENGPTEIARGTHRIRKEMSMQKIVEGKSKLEPIQMKMGDVLLRDVRGLHRGTPNQTKVPRPMVVIGYSRGWLFRPEVSIRIPRLEFEKLSPQARRMLRFNPITDTADEAPLEETYKNFAY